MTDKKRYLILGTNIAATFRRNSEIILNATCTIDGIQRLLCLIVEEQTTCFNQEILSPTIHNLSVFIPGNSLPPSTNGLNTISFDWLAFNSSQAPQADADILYYSISPTNMAPITFSFEFYGEKSWYYNLFPTVKRTFKIIQASPLEFIL